LKWETAIKFSAFERFLTQKIGISLFCEYYVPWIWLWVIERLLFSAKWKHFQLYHDNNKIVNEKKKIKRIVDNNISYCVLFIYLCLFFFIFFYFFIYLSIYLFATYFESSKYSGKNVYSVLYSLNIIVIKDFDIIWQPNK
jgi:ABC-type multidrug transport system fused ATPase/permease subunit